MEFRIIYLNETIQTLPIDSLILYRVALEKMGFKTNWKPSSRSLIITSAASEKKISISGNSNDETSCRIIEELKNQFHHFMEHLPMECLVDEKNQEADLNVSFSTEHKAITSPRAVVSYNIKQPAFDKAYQTYHNDIASLIDVTYRPSKNSFDEMNLQIHLELPENPTEDYSYMNPLSMFISTAICYTFVEEDESYHILSKQFLSTILNIKDEASLSPEQLKEESSDTDDDQKITASSPKHVEDTPPPSNEEEDIVDLDVYFNYTFHPSREKKQHTAYGELIIKNRGNVSVQNPIICIKVSPVEQVDLGGQILPPEMASLFGVNSSEGTKGWKYADKDWLTNAKEKGEYWISPIDLINIPSDEYVTLPNLQITIQPPIEDGEETVVIKGAVYIHGINEPFISENAITISF